jgi:glutamate dehydrogenase (NADP+)
MRQQWTFDEVDARLKGIMENIFTQVSQAAEAYGAADDYALGANIAGFLKVAQAMMAQGAV